MSVKKNYFYNVIYQMLLVILPIITVPYISRTLGAEGIGTNAYTGTIAQYFILLGTLGVGIYGNRTIAYSRNNKKELSENFWSIYLLQLSTTLISYILFIIIIFIFANNYKTIFIIQGINILAAAVDISWFLMGLEQFKKTVTRNIVIKITALILIFVFIKHPGDLWKFVLINAVSLFLGQLTMWMYMPKLIVRVRLKLNDITKHLIPSLKLFVPLLAVQIYTVLNRTVLGSLSGNTELGYYENAEKLVKMSAAIVTSLGPVMLPRISNVLANKEYDKMQEYVKKSFNLVNYIAIPMAFGISAISIKFAPWFFGPDFQKCGILMMVLSMLIPAVAWSCVTGMQLLLPAGKYGEYTMSVAIGAGVNFILNYALILKFGALGTAIATVITELTISMIQLYFSRHSVSAKVFLGEMWKYLIAGIAMFSVVKVLNVYMSFRIVTAAVQVLAGGTVYFIILMLLKSETNNYVVNMFSKLVKRS